MIIVREVFTAKPGQASKLAAMFKKMFKDSKARVMTDLVGPYNTVVMEMEVESLTAWDKMMAEYKAGKPDPNMTPELAEEMKHYHEMFTTGHREIYQIVE